MSDLEDIIELDSVIAAEKTLKKESAPHDDLYYPSEFDESLDEESEDDETDNDAQNLSLNILTETSSPVKTELVVPQTHCEQTIIDNCTQPDLKQILTLNRMKYNTLISLYNKIVTLIENCQEKLIFERNRMRNILEKKKINKFSVLRKLGYPYFKDDKCYYCPINRDVQLKQKRNEITLPYFMFTYNDNNWSPEDKATLLSSVKLFYYNIRQNELNNKMKTLKSKYESENVCKKELEEKISEIKNQLIDLEENKSQEVPYLYVDVDINWNKISSVHLDDKHSPTECKAYWKIFLHPSINKSPWTTEESKKLVSLVKSYNKQNWDEIALQLNTNRTGFSVCLYYFTNLTQKYKRTKFLQSEDDYLLDIINHCRVGNYIPWHKIAYHFQDRSRFQLYHRYKYYLSTKTNKEPFSIAEDLLILCLMKKFNNLSKCAKYIPNRSYMQVKSRYNNYLQNLQLNYGTWSMDEDKRLMAHVKKFGTKRWSLISKELNRTRSTVRQRYLTLAKKINKNPDVRPETKPFNNLPYLNKLRQRYNLLRVLYDKFKNFDGILTLEDINKSTHLRNAYIRKKAGVKDNAAVDQQLIDYFEMYCDDDKTEEIQTDSIQQSVDSVNNILNALGADLNIPNQNELEGNKELDETDIKILLELEKKLKHTEDSSKKYQSFLSLPGTSQSNLPEIKVKALIPPNLDSLGGLKHILLNHKKYKDQVDSTNLRDEHIESNLKKFDDDKIRMQIHFERKLFEYRFDSIFKWPCIMSLLEPSNQLKSKYLAEAQPSQKTTSTPKPGVTEKRKPGRPRKKDNMKVMKMIQVKLASKSNRNNSKNDDIEIIDLIDDASTTVKTENADIPEELIDIEKLNTVITLENTLGKGKLKVNNKRKTNCDVQTYNKRKRVENIKENSPEKTRSVPDSEECDLKLDIEKLNVVLNH